MLHELDISDDKRESNSATYCPEDNKLRLYTGRLHRQSYEYLVQFGYKATPKQDCSFVATWSPMAEDIALALIAHCDDIGDEDQSPEDRAADRAERFSDYRDKRRTEADQHAERYCDMPEAYGHQNAKRAERAAIRRDAVRTSSLSQWSKAEYWHRRTLGVIEHALHRGSPSVRRGRILVLEAELRRSASARWKQHYEMRLTYENAMLENEGGKAAEIEMEIGGFIGQHQIHAIHKSPVTGRIVSVKIMAPKRYWHGDGLAPLTLQSCNIERLGADAYRPPTPEEKTAFEANVQAKKAEAKEAKKGKHMPQLINPTDADAERMQSLLNTRRGEQQHVIRMTQAAYSAASKGAYARCSTKDISEKLLPINNYRHSCRDGRVCVFKIRTHYNQVIILTDKPQKPLPFALAAQFADTMPKEETHGPLIDEFYRLWREYGYDFKNAPTTEERARMRQLRQDFGYLGWATIECANQCALTDIGREVYRKFCPTQFVTA